MKKTIITCCLIITSFYAGKTFAQETFKWAEMGSFHATAMSSFHSAEMNKLQPARDSAASILKKAEQWQNSAIPSNYDATALKPLLQNLSDQCKAINDAVAEKKPDAVLKPLVLKAHNTFHAILSKTR
ncbi:MAG TPA: hypothetical protein VMT76_12435 [Puia sp.]|nr:hypothetical protein [Puia sp.]